MREFEIGDEVAISGRWLTGCGGDVAVIGYIYDDGDAHIVFPNNSIIRLPQESLRHKYPNPPHVHKDLIIEWAKGADIGIVDDDDDENVSSFHCHDPSWFPNAKYVVIEPTPPKTERELKIEELEAKLADITKQVEEVK